jgi:16S rRNA C967 or C1407 C5-methylase (RsmB/RsmF family)/NOL1/NOP2/fmu family ribosome biogenesis protein
MIMLPPDFIERIHNQSYIDAGALIESLGGPAATSIRVNRLKWPHEVKGYERVEWEPDGWYLPDRPLFTADPLFHAGVYYPQESSSMFAGEMFRQLTAGRIDLRVLDLCGAPGGKSTHLAQLLGDDGLLVANEVIRSRAAVLAENITKWGTGNIVVTNADPSRFNLLPGFFDVIVTDVPCSGEGMFRSAAAVQEWSVQNTRLCSERQRRIVMESWPALKPGGILIYSTCTFNPAENEENVAWIMDQTGAESLSVMLSTGSSVVPVHHNGVEGYGFYPGRVRGDGFFIAALRKPAGPVQGNGAFWRGADHGNPESRRGANHGKCESGRGSGQAPVLHGGRKGALKPSSQAFEKSESLAAFDRGKIVMVEGRIIALAAEAALFSYIDERLPVIKSGTLIGEVKKNVLIPAHDLAMSVKMTEGAWPRHSLTREEAIAFLRLETPAAAPMPPGRVLLTYRGVALGFVNNLGSRVNNGYPQGWRIRMDKAHQYTEIL